MASLQTNKSQGNAKVVIIKGFPATINSQKVKLDFRRQHSANIETVTIQDDELRVYFLTVKDAESFRANPPTFLKFGGKDHPITIEPNCPTTDVAEEALFLSPSELINNLEESVIECDQVHNWFELGKIPSLKNGILLQNFSEQLSPADVKEYFESQESHGGPILQIRFMVDGVLILFQHDDIAERVWEFRPHRICGEFVTISRKTVPEYYTDRFAFGFDDEAHDEAEATNYLHENFPEYDIKDVRRNPTQIFLVTFEQNLGQETLCNIIRKFQIDYDHKARAKLLPMTDCLRVEGVKRLSDAEIITLFENHKRTGGGQVTRLDRVKGNAVLLYFASYKDAERVFNKCGTKNLPIFQSQLKIFRYYHSFYESHYSVGNENALDRLVGRPGWPQPAFTHEITQPMMEFIQKAKHFEILQEEVSQLAKVECGENGLNFSLRMDSEDEELKSSSEVMIVHKCRRIVDKFFRRYEEIELDNLTQKEASDMLQDENIFIGKKEGGKSVICGTKDAVEKCVLKRNQVQCDMTLQPDEYRWILECKIIEKSTDWQLNSHSKTLHFRGGRSKLEKRQQKFSQRLKNLVRQMFCHEEKIIMEFVSCEANQLRISKKFRGITEGKLNVIFGVDKGSPYLYGERDSMAYASIALSGLLSNESAEFSPSMVDISQDTVVKKLQEDRLIIFDDKSPGLKIAGFQEFVIQAKEQLNRAFPGQIKWIKVFKTDPGIAHYMARFSQSFQEKCRDNLVSYDFSEADDGKIILKGHQSLDQVYGQMSDLSSKVAVKEIVIEEPGIAQFLRTKEGKDILGNASQFNSVVILGKTITNGQTLGDVSSPSEAKFEIDGLAISIYGGDILDVKSEAIITSVHPSYDFTKGELSRALLKRGGPGIQSDVLSQNDVPFRVTSGGLLSFKKIFHVIVEDLSNTLLDVLRIANKEKLGSIALPAIGTGGAHKAASAMAGSLISVFHDFAKIVPSPRHLKKIDVVIFDPVTLKEFLNVSRNLQEGTGTSPSGSPVPQVPFSMQFGPMKISIRQGDITDETTDAIVNSAGRNFELGDGMISKEICAKAGMRWMEFRLQFRSALQGQIQVTKAGKLKCKKIIHIATDPEMDLRERIVKILRKAQDEKFASISIPAIGSGKLGFPITEVAKHMRDGFHEFVGKNSGTFDHPKVVDVVIFEFSQLMSFINGFMDATNGTEGASGMENRFSRRQPTPQNGNIVTLKIYSESQTVAKRTTEQTKHLIGDAYTEELMEDDMILYRPEDTTQSFSKVCTEKHISWKKSSTSERAVTLKGPKDFVAEARNSVVALMKDNADILSDQVDYVWKHETPSGDWEAVEPVVNLILEEIHQKKSTTPGHIETCGKRYMLDLAEKKLENRRLKRFLKKDEKTEDA